MDTAIEFKPGNLVRARGREWVVLPELGEDLLRLRPLGGAEEDATLVYLPLEAEPPVPAKFQPPDPEQPGTHLEALLLRDALRLKLRAGAGPFRSFGNLNVEPRAYQLVPLLMALKQEIVRLLIADDVGIGKTIEAGLIARELLDRGEITSLVVICPPHLCEQWQQELAEKFSIVAKVVRTGTITRLERGLRHDESIFEVYPFTVVSLDYIKSERRRSDFLRVCPEFVIVDEAHTCVQSNNTTTRHQRYQLLKSLAEKEPLRGMLFLTATPHSGDDTAFHNLLGLLKPKFASLLDMPEGKSRRHLRDQLAMHFVQRRRGDIDEWKDKAGFPIRESREATYRLTGDWGRLFDDVLAYARTMVRRSESGDKLQQRMSWWAALALLRCISSSPAAASLALRTRLQAAKGETEQAQIEHIDRVAGETVMDESGDDFLAVKESVPAGTIDESEDAASLCRLIQGADRLRGSSNDPKLKALVNELRQLLQDGFRPVVFCRFIATAHYIGQELKKILDSKSTYVFVVTGELNSDQREERIEELKNLDDNIAPILIATDCLSEGVNLQRYFNAVIHYDLTWNPTRHEQREGRADRFGQASPIVRALMLYGENNPVDGAVLQVILRKADKIRKELGVSVPLPTENNRLVETIMQTVLLHGELPSQADQMDLDFGPTEIHVDKIWQTVSRKMTRTVFAQKRLTPEEVIPEWKKAVAVLGGTEDVERFVRHSAERLGAALDTRDGYYRLPIAHLPVEFKDRLNNIGFDKSAKISFTQPAPAGAIYIHRAHPVVEAFADHVTEGVLDDKRSGLGARASAIYTSGVTSRTVLYLLRLRSQLLVEQRGDDNRYSSAKYLLAEECLGIAVRGDATSKILTEDDALSLLSLEPTQNMMEGQKVHLLRQAIDALPDLNDTFERVAHERARRLLEDHRRIREASDAKGLRYDVIPALPVDTIGVYIFMPMVKI